MGEGREEQRERDRKVWGYCGVEEGLGKKQGEKGIEVDRRSSRTRIVGCGGKADLLRKVLVIKTPA